ncbi:hypothetical protein V7S76_10405 [Aquirufa sp. ROCK2-A2]
MFFLKPGVSKDDGVFTWKHLKMIFTILFFYYLIQGTFFLLLKLIDGNLFDRTFDLLKSTFTGENYVHPMYLVIIAPILEEIQFRLPMDLKKSSICMGLAIFLGNLLMWSLHIPLFYDEFQVLALLEFVFVYSVLFYVFSWIHITFLYNWRISVSNYVIFYFFSILFALMHLINYLPLELNLSFEYIIIVFSHFISACLFGYLRCQYGFWSGVIMHGFVNYF